jgi:hypothetical protein
MWSAKSDNSDTDDSGTESDEDQEINITIMVKVEDSLSPIDINKIISSKKISNESTIKLLKNIMLSKNKELVSKQQSNTSR